MKFLILVFILSCATLPSKRQDVADWLKKPMIKQLKPFISDGCSFWPEGTKENKTKWIRCCIIHDYKYWKGGTEKEREVADADLYRCIDKVQGSIIAEMMETGTNVGGSPIFKTSFRWGYGWNYTRGYLKISDKEKEYIRKLSPKRGEDLRKYLDKSKIDPEIEKIKKQIY